MDMQHGGVNQIVSNCPTTAIQRNWISSIMLRLEAGAMSQGGVSGGVSLMRTQPPQT
jgi:hypothetical protein